MCHATHTQVSHLSHITVTHPPHLSQGNLWAATARRPSLTLAQLLRIRKTSMEKLAWLVLVQRRGTPPPHSPSPRIHMHAHTHDTELQNRYMHSCRYVRTCILGRYLPLTTCVCVRVSMLCLCACVCVCVCARVICYHTQRRWRETFISGTTKCRAGVYFAGDCGLLEYATTFWTCICTNNYL